MINHETTSQTTGLVFGENIAAFGVGAAIALLEQNIPVDTALAYGTGVLDAMLLATGDIAAMRAAWETPDTFNAIFAKTAQLAERLASGRENMSGAVREAAIEAALNEPDALKIIADLHRVFDEKAIRQSKLHVVIMTVPENETEAKLVPLEAIPEGKLFAAVLRAATLPTLVADAHGRYQRRYPEEIGLSYLSEAGIADVITVGLSPTLPCPRYMRRIVIESSEYLDVSFDTTKAQNEREITLGRLDTLKALGLLEGHDYYIDPKGEHAVFDALVDALDKNPVPLTDTIPEETDEDLMSAVLRLLRQTAYSLAPNRMLSLLEIAAKQSGVPRLAIYTPDAFIAAILDALSDTLGRHRQALSPDHDLLSVYFHPAEENKNVPKFCLAYVLFLRDKNHLSINDEKAVLRAMSAEERLALFMLMNIHCLYDE